MEQNLNILVQSSEQYAPFAGVMITSLFENNKDIGNITVYLVTSDMQENNRRRFLTQAAQYHRVIKFLDSTKIDDFIKKNNAPQHNGSYAAYYKLFAISLIEDDIDRLIYLDSDLIINDSLLYLINLEFDNNVIAMSLDAMLSEYRQMINLHSANYYNTGVIVFDIKRWKSEKWIDKIIQHMTFIHASYPLTDQDILNLTLCGKIKTLPLTYNFNSGIWHYNDYHFFAASYGLKDYYSETEFIETHQKPIILHCMNTFGTRPWYRGDHAAKEVWSKYLKISLWNDYVYQTRRVSLLDKVQRFLFKFAPHWFFALIHRECLKVSLRKQIHDLKV